MTAPVDEFDLDIRVTSDGESMEVGYPTAWVCSKFLSCGDMCNCNQET